MHTTRNVRAIAAAAAISLVLGAAAAWLLIPNFHAAVTPQKRRIFSSIHLPTASSCRGENGGVAISPDGGNIAFIARVEGKTGLWIGRSLTDYSIRSRRRKERRNPSGPPTAGRLDTSPTKTSCASSSPAAPQLPSVIWAGPAAEPGWPTAGSSMPVRPPRFGRSLPRRPTIPPDQARRCRRRVRTFLPTELSGRLSVFLPNATIRRSAAFMRQDWTNPNLRFFLRRRIALRFTHPD